MLGLSSSLVKGGASLLTFVKDNLKLYLDFNSKKSDTLKFPSEGSTAYSTSGETYINFGDNDTLDMGTSSFTCAGWIKLNASSSTSRMMLGKTQNASGAKWVFGVNGSEKAFISVSDGSTTKTEVGATTISIGEWVHVVGVYDTDADTLSLFLNGVQDATMSASGIGSLSNSLDLRSGRGAEYPYNYNNAFDVCNIAIWKRALTPEEIQSIQNKSYSQLKGVEKTSLVSWWALDSQSNGVVQPATGETSEERVTNGSFDTDSDWGKGDGWSINATNGTASADGTGGFDYLSQSNIFDDANALYKMTITIDSAEDLVHSGIVRNGSVTNFYYGFGITSIGTHTVYFKNTTTGLSVYSNGVTITISNISIEKITSNTGLVTGATTTTSVYGGNAPILPRAVDVAKEGQADAIGNGSASFNGSSDYIEIDSSNFPNLQPYTISAWFKIDTLQASAILVWGDESHYERRSMFIWNGGSGSVWKLIPSIYGENPVGATALEINRWYHGALVVNPTAKTYEIYLNGILDGSGSFSNDFVSWGGTTGYIGKTGSNERFDGNISQVGLWQGALTQAQVQSIMESTSYSKIPADVKSTLGANTIAGITPTSSTSEIGWDASTEVLTFTENRYAFFADVAKSASTLHKIKYEILTRTAGTLSITGGSSAFVQLNIPDSVGSHTIYLISKDTTISENRDNFQFLSGGFRGTIGNISVQEVTNDIVAYYPLDGDSSRGNGTDDVTTGEVLGDEASADPNMEGSGNNDDPYRLTAAEWSFDATNNRLQYTKGGSGVVYQFNSQMANSFVANQLYRIKFTIGGLTSGVARLKFSAGDLAYEFVDDNTVGYANGTHYAYFTTTESGSASNGFAVWGFNTSGSSWYFTELSFKPVTSNTGVLK